MTFTDDFNRATLGTDWDIRYPNGTDDIWLSDALTSNKWAFPTDYRHVVTTVDQSSADHYAECVVTDMVPSAAYVGPTVRASADGTEGYVALAWHDRIVLYKIAGGGLTAIGTLTIQNPAGKTIRLEATGSRIEAYLDGVSVGWSTQADYATNKRVGMFGRGGAKADDFESTGPAGGGGGGGGGALSLVLPSSSDNTGVTTTALTVTIPAGVEDGDTAILFHDSLLSVGQQTTPTITGGTFTSRHVVAGSNNVARHEVFTMLLDGSEGGDTITVTSQPNATDTSVSLIVVRGAKRDGSNILDAVSARNSGSGTSGTFNSVVVDEDGSMIVGSMLVRTDQPGGITPSGMTELTDTSAFDAFRNHIVAYEDVATAGTVSPGGASWSASSYWSAMAYSILPGGVDHTGVGSSTVTISTTATGQRTKTGAGSATVAISTTATGERTKTGAGSATVAISTTATGHRTAVAEGGAEVPVGAGADGSGAGDGAAGLAVDAGGNVSARTRGDAEIEVSGRGLLLNRTLAAERLKQRPFGRVVADRPGRLGSGPVQVGIFNRGGVGQVASLAPGLDGYFERKKNKMSEAQITYRFSGTQWRRDRRVVDAIKAWRHELVVKWDNEVEWAGPIINLLEDSDSLTIKCGDLGAWGARRTIGANTHTGADLSTVGQAYVGKVFAGDTVQNYEVVAVETGLDVDRVTVATAPEYGSDALGALDGLDWTWYRRTLVMGPVFGPDYRIHLTGNSFASPPPVSDLGALSANKVIVVNPDTDPVVVGEAQDDDLIAADGLLERWFEDKTVGDVTQANAKAAYHLGRLSAPVIIDADGSSRLSPRAPITVAELIPGKLVLVNLAPRVVATFELVGVKVWFSGAVELELLSLAMEAPADHDERIRRLEEAARRS